LTGLLRQFQRRLALGQRLAQPPRRVADAVDHMQRHHLLGEAVVVVGAAEMQLADRDHRMPRLFQPVMP
jgi:hypothetical protein